MRVLTIFREGHEVREAERRATPACEAAASLPPPIFPKGKVGSVREISSPQSH